MDKPKGFDEPEYYRDYREYMLSEAWQKKRMERLVIDNFCCARCGSPYNLQVHHLKYPTYYGFEDVRNDLVTLCSSCHALVHAKDGYEKQLTALQQREEIHKELFFDAFIEKYKNLDFAFGGKENFCKCTTVKQYWAEMFGNDIRCPCALIQNWFRDRRIEKIFAWKSQGATQEDLARIGISRAMLTKYWNNKPLAEQIVGHKIEED